jgi:hypothetical protein
MNDKSKYGMYTQWSISTQFVGKWMELEIIMLFERSQTQRQIMNVFSHMWNLDVKITKQEGYDQSISYAHIERT